MPVPTAADAIVPFEDTAGGLADSLSEISVLSPPRGVGAHIRRRGEEALLGDVIVPAGPCLGPLQLVYRTPTDGPIAVIIQDAATGPVLTAARLP